jgi:hypothetical protein
MGKRRADSWTEAEKAEYIKSLEMIDGDPGMVMPWYQLSDEEIEENRIAREKAAPLDIPDILADVFGSPGTETDK